MSQTETKSAFAKRIGKTPQYVTKLIDEGRVVLEGEGRKAKVKVAESLELYEATKGHRDDVAARHEEGRQAPAPQTPAQGESDQSMAQAKRVKAVSEARRMAAVADQEEMARDKLAGALVSREDVDFVMRDFGATFRSLMENLADRLAPVVFPLTTLDETHAAINDIADELQQEMAETLKRRAEEFDK